MKPISYLSLIIAVIAICVALGKKATVSTAEVDRLVDARLIQREHELVSKYKPKLQEIEKELDLEPSNPTTLEDMTKSFGRMIFMPNK
jgi:hypothetical protein